jgi:hypothetical protein
MNDLIELKLAQLRQKYELNQNFIRTRVFELKEIIATATLTLDSLTSDFYKTGFSRHVKAMLPILISEQKDKIKKHKDELAKLLSQWQEDTETDEFLLDAQDYLRMSADASESVQEEFKRKYLPELVPNLNPNPKLTRAKARQILNEARIEFESQDVDKDNLTQELEHELFSLTSTVSKTMPYQRFVYFREFLRQKQGKTRVKVPKFVIAAVIENLTMNLIRIKEASESDIRKALRQTNLISYRELVPLLLRLFNRRNEVLDLPKEVEELLLANFIRIEKAFQRGLKLKGKNYFKRKSILSLPYLCQQICLENNLEDWAKYWSVSKCPKILQRHKETYVKIKNFL